jgi:hypothetical protein
MPNNFATTNFVSTTILALLQNDLKVAALFNTDWREDYEQEFPIGATVTIKRPAMLNTTSGLGYQPQDINRVVTTATINNMVGEHFQFDQFERLVSLERSEKELVENYLHPFARKLATKIDYDAATFAMLNTSNVVGTLGADPTTIDFALASQRRLDEKGCPKGGERNLIISPSIIETFIANNYQIFNPMSDVAKMYREGILLQIAGFDVYASTSLQRFTAGTAATHGLTIVGAGQSGNQLTVTGTALDTIKAGDKFSVAGVYAVNPMTGAQGSLGLMNFVAAQPLTLTGGNDTLVVLPAIYGPGSPYQNVNALPAANAALTMWPGTANPSGAAGVVSLALSEHAFAIVGGKYPDPPKMVEKAEQISDPDTGMSITYIVAWDQKQYCMTHRMDIPYGFGNMYQDNGVVAVAGA